MAQGVASAEEARQCCKAAPLGLSGQKLAAARRLSLGQVQAHLADLVATPHNPIRRTAGGFTI